jgi:ribosome-binding protein aMBF1 (putative translation factor)
MAVLLRVVVFRVVVFCVVVSAGSFSRYIKCEIIRHVSERRHPTVFPGFREMAERRHSVSGQLVSLRRELGLSQAEVASRMGTSQSAVARFEAGDLDVRLSTVQRYTTALGARLEWRIEHA